MENDNNVNGDLNSNSVLDALALTGNRWKGGIAKTVTFTLIAVVISSVPITVRESAGVTFGIIYKNVKASLGLAGFRMGGPIIMKNDLANIYRKYPCKNKDSVIYRYYQEDSVLRPLFYLLGSVFALILVLHYASPASEGPTITVNPGIGETVCSVAIDIAWIIPVSTVFMPFLLDYEIVDLIGSLMELLMRPVSKIPGRSAVNAIASFVSPASAGVLITSKLYQRGIYMRKETVLIATGLSMVSVGFAYKVIETADLSEHFLPIHLITLLVTLIVSPFMVRIPPLSRKASVFVDGRQQIKEEVQVERMPARAMPRIGASRAIKKTATAPSLFKEIRPSLLDNHYVLPKMTSLLTAVGIIAVLIAAYTPVFNWIGKLFAPLLILLQAPNATETAPAFPVGVTEMFLPVLMVTDKVDTLVVGARYMVVTISMVQIILSSETIVVMILIRIPIPLRKLIICFFEWTIVVIPISTLFMHLLFQRIMVYVENEEISYYNLPVCLVLRRVFTHLRREENLRVPSGGSCKSGQSVRSV